MKRISTLSLVALALGACDDTPATIPAIDATTALEGLVYLDVDASETVTAIDQVVEGGIVVLTSPGSDQVVASDTSLANGVHRCGALRHTQWAVLDSNQ